MNKVYVILLTVIIVLNAGILAAVLYKPGTVGDQTPSSTATPTVSPTASPTPPTPTATPTIKATPSSTPDVIGFSGNSEQISITNYSFQGSNSVALSVRNTGQSSVTIASATIDGQPATLQPSNLCVNQGSTGEVTLSVGGGFSAGAQYAIRLVTAAGTTVPYTMTYNP